MHLGEDTVPDHMLAMSAQQVTIMHADDAVTAHLVELFNMVPPQLQLGVDCIATSSNTVYIQRQAVSAGEIKEGVPREEWR